MRKLLERTDAGRSLSVLDQAERIEIQAAQFSQGTDRQSLLFAQCAQLATNIDFISIRVRHISEIIHIIFIISITDHTGCTRSLVK